MAYIKTSQPQIGDWVITTQEHKGIIDTFIKGIKVKIIDITDKGYSIIDKKGHGMCGIGWVI